MLIIELGRSACPLSQLVPRRLAADGFCVDLAEDGPTAVKLAGERDYAVILLDLAAPQPAGRKVITQLRTLRPWTPILALTDNDPGDLAVLGADDCLPKPMSHPILTAHLRTLLRRGSAGRGTVLSAGDLIVDPTTRTCQRGDQPISLTPREFELLTYLLRNAGHTVSKHSIMGNLWGPGQDADANIVQVYIGYLRKKIDIPFGRAGIETVRGIGYRLRGDGG